MFLMHLAAALAGALMLRVEAAAAGMPLRYTLFDYYGGVKDLLPEQGRGVLRSPVPINATSAELCQQAPFRARARDRARARARVRWGECIGHFLPPTAPPFRGQTCLQAHTDTIRARRITTPVSAPLTHGCVRLGVWGRC